MILERYELQRKKNFVRLSFFKVSAFNLNRAFFLKFSIKKIKNKNSMVYLYFGVLQYTYNNFFKEACKWMKKIH